MNETLRRIIMMSGIILVGSIFIFFDTSIPLLIGGTVAFGILLIMGLGLLTVEDIKSITTLRTHSKGRTKSGDKNKKSSSSIPKKMPEPEGKKLFSGFRSRLRSDKGKETSPAVKGPASSKKTESSRDPSGIGAGLTLAMGSVKARFLRSKDSSHGQKIDELLDSAIHEPVSTNHQVTAPVEDQPEEEHLIPDIFSDEFDDEDFGMLDDIDLGEEMMESELIPPSKMHGNQDSFNNTGNHIDDGMMSIEAILAGEASSENVEGASPGEPHSRLPEEDGMEFGSIGDRDDEIEVDGGILTLDDDLTRTPFHGSVEKSPFINEENEFSFGIPEDTDSFGLEGPGYPEEESFGTFRLDDLDLDEQESLDDLELDIVEEEEIDSIGLLPDDVLSESNHLKEDPAVIGTMMSKTDVLNFGGFGDSSTEELMSFGGSDDDGLLSMLKTDLKSKKSIQDASLVRSMKDTDVGVQELVEGLEDVLRKMGGKPSSLAKNQDMEK